MTMDLEGHNVLQVWRKHWWPAHRAAAQAWLLVQALYRPAATILLLIIAAWSWVLALPDWTPPQLGLALVLLLLAMGGKVAWEVVDWRNDTYSLTESHVVDVQRKPLFGSRKQREIGLGRIQTVSAEQPSRVQVLLNYGTLVIEAAGNRPEFWHGLPNPNAVKAAILQAEQQYEQRRDEEMRRLVQESTLQTMGWATSEGRA